MSSPLSGIRVLDLSRVLAAPMCSMALGDLGADVLKVEHPVRGDDTRGWGLKIGSTNSSYFNAANRNKECAAIDLKSPEGRELVLALVRQSDVLIQNFKTGDMDRLGLSYEALKALNPRLVYCSVTGYGSDGPEARRPGYDLVVQGETGLMALNGEEGQGPLKIGLAAVDMFTGQYAAQAVLAALFERERTGRGCHVEVALYDAGVSMVSYYGLQALAMGGDPLKYGNSHPAIVPYGVFDTADGPVVVTIGTDEQFEKFCAVIDRLDLAADERFASNRGRSEHRLLLLPVLQDELGRRSKYSLLDALSRQGIPCGEVLGLHEALRSRRSECLMVTREDAEGRTMHTMMPPYRIDGERLPVRSLPPSLGEHTDKVLRQLGLPPERIAELRQKGVIR